ncbi:MAG: helix-turn-helix domain-containing protein [Bacteroidales bacterium]|jgi:AcrR family transcriptional regulator|nr:TetR/AcrR family transcriptional regulator [Bacteroidales bacterium]MDI9591938.1 helix-turn-helix domain-containing protein [Bacteroidota bacterium]MBP7874011.1 TetR/AcrR family transcriptional regulator [Bacteroidales bacterium]MCO6468817.1 TetR/AcrR family transcriptional regulator [Bacteroidales bacterium]MCZ2282002.1 TetR/AcrR family transcriptional regulator [Bacteroidales bacterium]
MAVNDTRDIILSVADRLFSRFGFHKTSMDEIAKTARKAKGSLYYHFASKEELFREVISKEFGNLKAQLNPIVENKEYSAFEKLKNYLLKRMEILNSASNYHETLKADFFEQFHFIDELRSDLDEWEKEKFKTIVMEGVMAGEFKVSENIDVILDIFLMVLKGLEIPFFLQGKYNEYAPHFEGLIYILNNGIAK